MKTPFAAAFSAKPAATAWAALLAAACFPDAAAAQQPDPKGANAKKFGVAVVDVGYIFKNHTGFKAEMEGMKGELQAIDQQLDGDRKKIITMEEQKRQFNAGSKEFSDMDERIAKAKVDFQIKMQRMRKDFLTREAAVYHKTYQQVASAITRYAEYYQIGMVLRYNSEPADPTQRDQVLKDINKPVQFQNKIDITEDILSMLNRPAPPSHNRERNAANPRAVGGRQYQR